MILKKVLFLFFISFIVTVSNVSASNYVLDFENTLIDSNEKKVDVNSVDVDNSLAIKVTIANPNDFWIKIDSLRWAVKSKKNNDDFDVIVIQDFDVGTITKPLTEIVLPPNSKIDRYIILEKYNSLENDGRIGSWLIDLETQLEGIKYFNGNDFTEINNYQVNVKPSKGNLIQFTVTKEPVKIYVPGALKYIPGLEDINPYSDFIATILSSIAALLAILKLIKK